ncbi:m7GpppN-mRNA hydrolase-like [Clavelina lepadiformis]|uniref:m7GpppN-mRNA hydrolase-like n=1 Tax=Clavelina lepadiformis TaxID=159417 RepID=UPI004041F6FF
MSSQLKIKTSVLDDLCSRFLLNIPQSEKEDMIRFCFQIEIAHWFYLDFYRPEDPTLPDCRMREFAKVIFTEYPFLLNPRDVDVVNVLDRWKEYKRTVPTYGAILLDSSLEHVLLVQGFWIKASWGFPKGKVNKNENPEVCATREVLEETGYNISGKIDKTQYAEHHLNEQLSRLYYVPGVPMDTTFKPQTRGEIKSLQWFNINDLPAHKKDLTPKHHLNMAANCFFMVIPFIKQIRRWISTKKSTLETADQIPNPAVSVVKVKNESKRTRSKERLKGGQSPIKSGQGKHTSGLPSKSPSSTSSKMEPESVQQQMTYFQSSNNAHLELFNSLSKDTNGSSSRQKKRGNSRCRGERLLHQVSTTPMVQVTSQARGRILQNCFIPNAWKNFTFNHDALSRAIMGSQT